MSVVAVIPARYASTRFPGKALSLLRGVPLVEHCYRQARRSKLVDRVVVATDDARIAAAVERAGGAGAAVLTSAACASGTDRVLECVRRMPGCELVVNLQGDEPCVRPSHIDSLVRLLQSATGEGRRVPMATLAVPLASACEYRDPNAVKVVATTASASGEQGRRRALYFSRAPVPSGWDAPGSASEGLRHLGLYGFRRDFLLGEFAALPAPSPLEATERLEQLRVLEAGHSIALQVVEEVPGVTGVDTPEQLAQLEKLLADEQVWRQVQQY